MNISLSTLKRLPIYLHYLKTVQSGRQNISATYLSRELALGQVQVRKDLSAVGAGGKPKTGYDTTELISSIEKILGCNSPTVAILIGVGNLGRALLSHNGFKAYGLSVVAGFDTDNSVIGKEFSGKKIYPMSKLDEYLSTNDVKLGILALPDGKAQDIADKLIAGGVKGIWNFTQTHILHPDSVAVQNENMAASLALLKTKLN